MERQLKVLSDLFRFQQKNHWILNNNGTSTFCVAWNISSIFMSCFHCAKGKMNMISQGRIQDEAKEAIASFKKYNIALKEYRS